MKKEKPSKSEAPPLCHREMRDTGINACLSPRVSVKHFHRSCVYQPPQLSLLTKIASAGGKELQERIAGAEDKEGTALKVM